MSETVWQKSSFCGGGGNNCLELSADGNRIRIRESTAPDVTVTTTPEHLHTFLRSVKAGRYDRPSRTPRKDPRA